MWSQPTSYSTQAPTEVLWLMKLLYTYALQLSQEHIRTILCSTDTLTTGITRVGPTVVLYGDASQVAGVTVAGLGFRAWKSDMQSAHASRYKSIGITIPHKNSCAK